MQKKNIIEILYFIILKLNVHKLKLTLHTKMANFNYKVQNVNELKL